ncbi:chorismate--pyruvate lyase family protein [Massilia yuzhufengensis]|uniref:Probable chorismate pyruvate-lyase n=1 Tax=Massilia yuzhufengensis TaxID=1164594 RepID=A0A1I1X3S3_9BURK|nr:chorismate lyase [Massilia yuzhufengensis]SFE02017.1 chorismate lyase [Massilia yuzhufengensis]
MRAGSLRLAAWQPHAGAVRAPEKMRDWLTTEGSLTARLVAHSAAFRVRRLHQDAAVCLADEARAIGLPRPGRVWEREVLLVCDGRPVVFGHTVVPASCTAADWPLFSALGERSLGTTLFYDPLVRRGQLEYARIRAGHPLFSRVRAATGGADDSLYYARRCVYRRRQGLLLVTEVFLPEVLNLKPADTLQNTK